MFYSGHIQNPSVYDTARRTTHYKNNNINNRSLYIFLPTVFLLYSIGWLRLLHHCLTHVSDLEAMMASAAAPTANLLQTCAALLMSPYCGMHSPNIEAVLVKIGLQSTRIGLKLIDILLRNCAASGTDPASRSHTAAAVS